MIEKLLRDVSPSSFIQNHYLKFPYTSAGGASGFSHIGTWETIRVILGKPAVDVLVVRRGELVRQDAPLSFEAAQTLHESGCTLVIRNAEKHHDELADLAAGFRRDFQGAVDIHIYCTPPGQFGFGWHYDAEDVFILQTQGSKQYSLRKNTVHPWPLIETIPRDMRHEREVMPLMRSTLEAGDWLYIPAGYWHCAQSVNENASISLAIGVMSPAAMDVFDYLRPRLLGSLLWRQRLPAAGPVTGLSEMEVAEQYRCIFSQLGADLASALSDERFLHEFLASRNLRERGEVCK